MKKLFCIILITFAFTGFIQSQNKNSYNPLVYSAPFLLIAPDARASGLGEAGCASTPDANSTYWNPSKLLFCENRNGFSFSYTDWESVLGKQIGKVPFKQYYISAYTKIGTKNTISISGKYFLWPPITFTNIVGNTIGENRPREYNAAVSYSRLLGKKFSIAGTLGYINSNIYNGFSVLGTPALIGHSVTGGISCYWRDSIKLKDKTSLFGWGINLSDIGQKIRYSTYGKSEFIPTNLRLGVSYKIVFNKNNSLEFICDANKLLVPTPPVYKVDSSGNPLMGSNGNPVILYGKDPNRSVINSLYTSFYDAPAGFKEELHEVSIGSGIEYVCFNALSLRAGLFHEDKTKGHRRYITAGIGLKLASIGFDFSYLFPTEKNSIYKNTWRISFVWAFNSLRKKKN